MERKKNREKRGKGVRNALSGTDLRLDEPASPPASPPPRPRVACSLRGECRRGWDRQKSREKREGGREGERRERRKKGERETEYMYLQTMCRNVNVNQQASCWMNGNTTIITSLCRRTWGTGEGGLIAYLKKLTKMCLLFDKKYGVILCKNVG